MRSVAVVVIVVLVNKRLRGVDLLCPCLQHDDVIPFASVNVCSHRSKVPKQTVITYAICDVTSL